MLVEGWRSVRAAIEAGAPLTEVVATDGVLAAPGVSAELEAAGVPVYRATERVLAGLGMVETGQGILATVEIREQRPDDVLRRSAVLALDGVQDPGNVGTMIRTAAWFGVEAVLAGAGTADFFNPKTVRASMGALWTVEVARADDLAGALQRFGARGGELCGADLAGEPLHTWVPAQDVVLVIGSEARGISESVKTLLERRVVVPGDVRRGGVESLNASVAAGIVLYHWLGRR